MCGTRGARLPEDSTSFVAHSRWALAVGEWIVAGVLIAFLLGCGTRAVPRREAEKGDNKIGPHASASASTKSVFQAYMEQVWESSIPPLYFLIRGRKASVDKQLGEAMTTEFMDAGPVELFGEGLKDGDNHWYRDANGIRLMAHVPSLSDTIILSAESTHAAHLVDANFAGLRTESGIGLGDSEERVVKAAGDSSFEEQFGDYKILWYLKRPDVSSDPPDMEDGGIYVRGNAAAYALKHNRVVEIWLHIWSSETFGGSYHSWGNRGKLGGN